METNRWIDEFFNWQRPLASIPLGNAVLGDLVIATAVKDASVDVPDGGFKMLMHPMSLHTNLLVIVDRGHRAFETGKMDMENMKLSALIVMVDFKTIIEILKSPENEDVDSLLQIPLSNIEKTADSWNRMARNIVAAFQDPVCLVDELFVACKTTLERQVGKVEDLTITTQDLEVEMVQLKDEFTRFLTLLKLGEPLEPQEAAQHLLKYSCKALHRLEHHWNNAYSSLKSMAEVVDGIAKAGLNEYVAYIREVRQNWPLSASDMKFVLSATVKVHQICDAVEKMADLYRNIIDKYVIKSFDTLAQLVSGQPDLAEPGTLLSAGYRTWDRIVPTRDNEDDLMKQVDQRLDQIESEYISLHDVRHIGREERKQNHEPI